MTEFSEEFRRGLDGSFKDATDFGILVVGFLPSMTITGLNYLVPILFRILVRPERYSAAFEIKLTLARTILLRLASLLTLVLTLYTKLKQSGAATDCRHKALSDALCWETYVGQQLYRLSIFDAALTVVNTLVQLPVILLFRRCLPSGRCPCITNREFDLVGNTLDLIYSQSICWLGMIYCPALPLISMLKGVIIFYTKYYSIFFNIVQPPQRLYGASSSSSLFMNVLLLSFITCALPLGYHISSLSPSSACGPFRGFPSVWSTVSHEVLWCCFLFIAAG